MRDVFTVAAAWIEARHPFALATLVGLHEAKTAALGTTIAVDAERRIVGNIGAGCYESEIIEAAALTLADGISRRLDVNLDSFDELSGGTACGAVMQLVVWRPGPSFLAEARAIASGERNVVFTVEDFSCEIPAKRRLILIGATALAADLAAMARRADYHVIVVDPRPLFATHERVPGADELVRLWPEEYLPRAIDAATAIVVLSHDPKFDLPALRCALRSDAAFIGLLGSRRAQSARRDALRDEFDESTLARIHGPVGLDIGGVTTAETAISILAGIVASRTGRAGSALLARAGAIH